MSSANTVKLTTPPQELSEGALLSIWQTNPSLSWTAMFIFNKSSTPTDALPNFYDRRTRYMSF